MDVKRVLAELIAERDLIDQTIADLERIESKSRPGAASSASQAVQDLSYRRRRGRGVPRRASHDPPDGRNITYTE
jgi:hypothetical protein